jgi:hypothetical protein
VNEKVATQTIVEVGPAAERILEAAKENGYSQVFVTKEVKK